MPRKTPTPNLAGLSSGLEGASTRLRKTFRYDPDSDSDIPEVMDEQEQESLITTLTHQNRASNTLTLRLLFSLPILSSLPYLITFLSPSLPSPIFSVLAISSLASTLYLLYTLPTTSTGFPFLDKPPMVQGRRVNPPVVKGPLEEYLPWLNLLLAAVALLLGLVQERIGKGGPHPVLLGALPGLVYGVCVGVKRVMAGVDVEGELGGLRYGYKGA
ncbi:hypothetical protein QBC40DRAFT_338200 [Triangularia verruculosa]|uniref:Uncharacterized protein n=1 Tax=Triangularia verruculosa TaxID=2587418 RepID=A0AAN6XKT8_9PEZI|nr:hypothetical protein QBC40DRAFT_338200 [Triangularia verruculosa]